MHGRNEKKRKNGNEEDQNNLLQRTCNHLCYIFIKYLLIISSDKCLHLRNPHFFSISGKGKGIEWGKRGGGENKRICWKESVITFTNIFVMNYRVYHLH